MPGAPIRHSISVSVSVRISCRDDQGGTKRLLEGTRYSRLSATTVRGVNRTNHLLASPVPFADFTPSALALHAEIAAAQEAPLAANASDQLSYGR